MAPALWFTAIHGSGPATSFDLLLARFGARAVREIRLRLWAIAARYAYEEVMDWLDAHPATRIDLCDTLELIFCSEERKTALQRITSRGYEFREDSASRGTYACKRRRELNEAPADALEPLDVWECAQLPLCARLAAPKQR
jgi:hypothetical protein